MERRGASVWNHDKIFQERVFQFSSFKELFWKEKKEMEKEIEKERKTEKDRGVFWGNLEKNIFFLLDFWRKIREKERELQEERAGFREGIRRREQIFEKLQRRF